MAGDGEQSGDWDPEDAAILRSFFLEEAHDHLEGVIGSLMGLEKLLPLPVGRPAGPAKELIDELFRKTHTLKGSASTVGQIQVSEAAHLLEETFSRARNGTLALDRTAIDTWLSAADLLRETVESVDDANARDAVGRLRQELVVLEGREQPLLTPRPRGAPRDEDFPELDGGPDDITDMTARPGRQPMELPELPPEVRPAPPVEGGGRMKTVEMAAVAASAIAAAGAAMVAASGVSTAVAVDDDGEISQSIDLTRAAGPMPMQRHLTEGNTIRVEVARVDELMDAASELVFDHTRIDRRAQEIRGALRELDDVSAELGAAFAEIRAFAPPGAEDIVGRFGELESAAIGAVAQLDRAARALVDDSDALKRTALSLQQGLTRVRMMSVRWLFARLARPLRDLARAQGKQVELVAVGEDTELDKTVVEQITDPLIHLIRNAVTHGIELPEQRRGRHKTPRGRVTIEARQEGDSVYLEVVDDGDGIDPTRLRETLVASKRMTAAQAAATPNDQILATIFEAGVSTRNVVDHAAGRGVGLDVVRQNILRLGGDIVVSSEPGTGTRFTIRLPLTTAISQALLFKTGGHVYAIPYVHVVDTITLARTQGRVAAEADWHGERIPAIALDTLIGLPPPPDEPKAPAIVIGFGDRHLAVVCEKVVGPREIVVKGLGALLAPLKLYSGATISGSGKVQLILDVAELIARAPSLAPAADVVKDPEHTDNTHGLGEVTGEALPLPRVLVVDDSRTMRESIARILGGAGYIIESAVDGREAYDILLERRFDLVVTDLEMPRMGGYELIARVRRVPALRAVPIIVVSARSSDPKRSRALELGAQIFMSKPVNRTELVKHADELVGHASTTRTS